MQLDFQTLVVSQKEKMARTLDERKAQINNIAVNATLYDKRNSM
jgi:hypothetical protein